MSHRLLVIEGASTLRDASVHAMLARDGGFVCEQISWDALVPQTLRTRAAHLIVAVLVPHTQTVVTAFESLRHQGIGIPTFAVLPGEADEPLLRMAVESAEDFVVYPIRDDELRLRVGRVLGASPSELEAVRQRLLEQIGMTQLVGQDAAFLRAIEQVPRFARSGMPVLITGETGTGKELCARAIHHLGPRRNYPFIAVDCGAIPDHLFENELFGHARGAYTDAHRDQRGLLALAEGGTVFLDEIDALSLTAQAKLLRFLQERTFRPLGSDRFVQADVNVIAATNRDLQSCVRDKQLRADLFYRLNVLRLHLPPLRERRGDIGLLAVHFLQEQRFTTEVPAKVFAGATLRMLAQHDWPGNVRELANVVQRAVVACDGRQILPCHVVLPPAVGASAEAHFRSARAAAVAAFERRYVEDLLRKHGGNVTQAARDAQKERRAFGRLIKKYGIDRTTL